MRAVAFFDQHGSIATNRGQISGTVEFLQKAPGRATAVRFRLRGFRGNTVHGVHIHTYGDATDGCTSSCSHYNPAGSAQRHGSKWLYGNDRHVGDLCNNITADEDGDVEFDYVDDLVQLWGNETIIGRMVVIHDNEDDLGRYRDNPDRHGLESATTGNAGSRIACAVIGVADPTKRNCPGAL
jgi:Cu-Zn family superoxide dismutase